MIFNKNNLFYEEVEKIKVIYQKQMKTMSTSKQLV